MAVPSTPSSYNIQQGNGQVFLSWDITATATSYKVQRSTDGVTYSTVASPVTNYYLDTTVTVGTNYYYQVAATNGTGDSAYATAQSIVPAYSGDLALGQVRLLSQQRADRVGSNFVTLPEWNSYINQSYFELFDILVTAFEDYYLASPVTFQTDGSDSYNLPNGSNYSSALPFYKLMGVDLGLSNSQNAFVTLKKYDFIARNRFVYPQLTSTYLGVFNLRYRVLGDKIHFIPTPSSGQYIKLWYIPRLVTLLQDTDLMKGISGWSEYVIVDAAIKALQKEESDVSVLMAQKMALLKRIEEAASNRDAGIADTISNIRGSGGWDRGGSWGPGEGSGAGW
jgi:hypothetical protein